MKPVLIRNSTIRSSIELSCDSGQHDWWSAVAPAKLNLFLHIVGQREDGYHLLQTLFQFLDWHDELNFNCRDDGEIYLQSDLVGVSAEDNLVVRAARLLQQEAQEQGGGLESRGCNIVLRKNLPTGAGLGGGSSDAATTLVALNELWQLQLPQKRLLEMGLGLGADVPVFVAGKACWAEGVGEKMTEVELHEPAYLMISPGVHVDTVSVFRDPQLTRNCSPIKIADFLAGRSRNVCQEVVLKRHPAVEKALGLLEMQAGDEHVGWQALGGPRMTGTGSSVFLACRDRQLALALQQRLKASNQYAELQRLGLSLNSHVANGTNKSSLYNAKT